MQNSFERMREDMTSLNQQTEALQSQARVPGYQGIPSSRPGSMVEWSTQMQMIKCQFHLVVLVESLRPLNEH